MQRFALVLIALLLLGTSAWAQNLDVEEINLDNGLTVLSVRRPETPRVFCAVIFKVGGVNETAGKTGVAHMLEHMLFKGTHVLGTKDYARDVEIMKQIDDASAEIYELEKALWASERKGIPFNADSQARLDELEKTRTDLLNAQREHMVKEDLWGRYMNAGGTGLNASTGTDTTQYYVELPSNKIELFFWAEADRMANPVLREFYPERDVVKEERRMRYESTPTGRVWESFNSMFYEAHPYRNPVIGWMSDLDNLQREDAIDFFNVYYAPNNAVVVLVGDVEHDQIRSWSQSYFGQLKRGEKEPPIIATVEPDQVAEKRMKSVVDADDFLMISFKTIPAAHPDMYALDLLAEVLDGRSGRLYRSLVDDKKIALSAGARQGNQIYAGSFRLTAQPQPGKHQEVEEALLAGLADLGENPPTADELKAAQNQFAATYIDAFSSNQSIAFMVGRAELSKDWKTVNGELDKYNAVTVEDILRVHGKYFGPTQRNVLWMVRKEAAEEGADTNQGEMKKANGE